MRKSLIFLVTILLLLSCRNDRVAVVIGILNHASVAEDSIRGFKDVMEKNGYVEGENASYHYSGPVPKGQLEAEAAALMKEMPDLILTVTMPATVAAIAVGADRAIPIVFAPNSNPVEAGIVQSMERPGGNITGVSFWIQEGKRLEWLKRIVPGVRRIAVPYMDWDRSPRIDLEKLQSTARKLGVEIIGHAIADPGRIESAAATVSGGVDAVFIPADALIESNAPTFIERATAQGIPVSSPQSYGFSKGALFAFGFVQYETGRQGARQAIQILQGERPGNLPVEMAETKLMINLKTAASLGIEIPSEIISKADMVLR